MNWYEPYVTITHDERHKRFLRRTYRVAAEKSDDSSTKTGAILVNHAGNVLVSEANHIPERVRKSPNRLYYPDKKDFIEHAERNVIYKAANFGIMTKGLTMYMPWLPCSECARAIVQSGIDSLISHTSMIDRTPEDWRESIETALTILGESEVNLLAFDGELGMKGLFRGELFDA